MSVLLIELIHRHIRCAGAGSAGFLANEQHLSVVTVKLPAFPAVNVVLFALVITGG